MADIGTSYFKAQRFGEAVRPLSEAVLANPGDDKLARRLAVAVQQAGFAGTGGGEAKPTPVETQGQAPQDPEDPLAVMSDIARRVDNERVSGRLIPPPEGFADFGYPSIDYANHPGYGADKGLLTGEEGDVIKPFYEAFAPIWNGYLSMKSRASSRPVSPAHAETFRTLERDGILGLRMTDAERAELLERTEPVAEEVRRRRAELEPGKRGVEASSGHLYHVKNKPTDFVDFLNRVFENHGILEMASAYQGVPMAVKLANLQINSVEDMSIVGNSLVGDLPLSPAYYMHIDSSIGVMKVIIYRSKVSAEQGAFRYVPGSNRIGVTPFELCVRKATDKSDYDSSKTKFRRRFVGLPPFLQKKANFGNDLQPGHPELEPLLERERVMTSDDGDMLLFDNNGIHRGAIFESGEREIIQVLLAP
ncbi:hypothetical protein GCM10017083_22920 [Thalassobaculum fulvum]|uniref:Uncharacterized protein n=1 Tax=Thalassobaculum fulvum TaxID=1633335 RepID=A0A918XRP7_9PROT|nr:hypothetical protein [Thalassobaculum fulvum]GHD49942.1 hypothetical protein GCM10017083_22920 [Thalassobaculum fulvum]